MMPDEQTAASIAGGLAGAVVNRSLDPWYRKIGEGMVGAAVGVYCGPSIAASAGVDSLRDIVATCFAVGAAGYGLLTMLVDYAKGAAVKDWLSRFAGGNGSPK